MVIKAPFYICKCICISDKYEYMYITNMNLIHLVDTKVQVLNIDITTLQTLLNKYYTDMGTFNKKHFWLNIC